MSDYLFKGNLIMFSITTIFVQTFNRTIFFIRSKEGSKLREISHEEPSDDGTENSKCTFNDENPSPAVYTAGMNLR
jgi:hypothetical protein